VQSYRLNALFGFTNVAFTLDFSDIWSAIFVKRIILTDEQVQLEITHVQ